MSSHPRLFEGIRHQGHSDTSREAARQIDPHVSVMQAMVLDYLLHRGEEGATDEEMQHGLSMNPSTQRPRRCELVDRGVVVDSQKRRKTASGRKATVWVVREDARAVYGGTGDDRPGCAVCHAPLSGRQRYFCGDDCRMTWHHGRTA